MSSSEEEDYYQAGEEEKKPISDVKVYQETTELDKDDPEEEEDNEGGEDDGAGKLPYTKKSSVDAKVGNPLLQDAGVLYKNYIDYEVSGIDYQGEFRVRRRYKEFDLLRSKLVQNWPGYFIPPLPEKKNTGNTDPEFVQHRTYALNYFIKRCSKLPHLFRSTEMQVFLRSQGDTIKALEGINILSPTEVYARNIELFPEYNKELTEKVERSIKRYFKTLASTIEFFNKFRKAAKNLQAIRPTFKYTKIQFMKYAVNDYKNKLKKPEDKKMVDENMKDYHHKEKVNDMGNFVRALKDVTLDLKSFMLLKIDLENFLRSIDKLRKNQAEAQKNLARVRSHEADIIKDGLFKKVSKKEKLEEIEKEIKTNQENIEALEKNRNFTFFLMNYHEFPLLIEEKRLTFAKGILEFANKRNTAIDHEMNMLKAMHDHYRLY